MSTNGNYLYYGDNLDVLRRHVKDDSVDLIYLDPPFKSNKDYNVLFVEQSGERAAAQIKAFEDTWRWDQEAAASFQEVVESGGRTSQVLRAFRGFLDENDMLAYLSMMAPRLKELKRVLKPTGSIFLHCDPTAGHYLKVLMDAVFGPPQFRNEIAWCYHGPGSPGLRQFLRKHDTIFWYSNSPEWTFNADAVRVPHKEKTRANFKAGLVGSGFTQTDRTVIHKQGKVPEDWWIIAIAPRGKEYLGYPTQKPKALLERIIKAASNPGDTILDPFCGCGTTIEMAHRLDRRWIGIDITHLAINLIKHRLQEADGTDVAEAYRVIGEPVTFEDAEELAREDPYQFQWWALGLVGARPVEQKKGADKGIDGRLYFHEGDEAETMEIILSVKGGKTGAAAVRDLRGVIEREQAALGVFITLKDPTKPMKREAASAGFYESTRGRFYPRLQILTIAQLLEGKAIDYPVTGAGIARPPSKPEQLVLTEQRAAKPREAELKPTPDLATELLRRTAEQRPPVNLTPILEDLNIEVRTDPTVKEDARLVAMTPPVEGQRPGAWMLYLNPSRSEARKRFTIAHELGHVALHGESHALASAARGAAGRRTSREREVEKFAANLLMPEQVVRAAVRQHGANIERLRALFLVSPKAMEIRLRELGLG